MKNPSTNPKKLSLSLRDQLNVRLKRLETISRLLSVYGQSQEASPLVAADAANLLLDELEGLRTILTELGGL